MPIFDAAMKYQEEKVPLVVFAGAEYGNGSSRDWAAKGTRLLGVRAVITQSFERIHRSNLVGMGVLPLTFENGASWSSLGIKGDEKVTIRGLQGGLKPRQTLTAVIESSDGSKRKCRCFAASTRWTSLSITATAASFTMFCEISLPSGVDLTFVFCQPRVRKRMSNPKLH